ncbi:MAG: hypothetical protein ABII18_06090 [bacterium]|nr:hypothetical protein [bacterium]MBU1917192.1 hypothetical protein [bacterium]
MKTINFILILLCLCFINCQSAEAKKQKQCDELDKKFAAMLNTATDKCKTDADCSCYPAGYTVDICGGICDKITADKLRAIDKINDEIGCGYRGMCGAWICNPVCVDGFCKNDPDSKR